MIEFVKKGNQLIFTNYTAIYDGKLNRNNKLEEFASIKRLFKNQHIENDVRLKFNDNLIKTNLKKIPVGGQYCLFEALTNEVICNFTGFSKVHYGKIDESISHPAIIKKNFGKGSIIYIGFPIGLAYLKYNILEYKLIIEKIIDEKIFSNYKIIKAPKSLKINILYKENYLYILNIFSYVNSDSYMYKKHTSNDDIEIIININKKFKLEKMDNINNLNFIFNENQSVIKYNSLNDCSFVKLRIL